MDPRAVRQHRARRLADQQFEGAPELRRLLQHVPDRDLRRLLEKALDDYGARVEPRLPELRRQLIHGDLHASNVLVDASEAVCGVIDFGDMVRAPLINDVAVSASYLRVTADDPLRLVARFVAGYETLTPLEDVEIDRRSLEYVDDGDIEQRRSVARRLEQ